MHTHSKQLRTREEILSHCKEWVERWRRNDLINSTLLSNYTEAIIETDCLTYPLEAEEWITEKDEPMLWDIVMAAEFVDNNHTDSIAWSTLVEKVEAAVAAG